MLFRFDEVSFIDRFKQFLYGELEHKWFTQNEFEEEQRKRVISSLTEPIKTTIDTLTWEKDIINKTAQELRESQTLRLQLKEMARSMYNTYKKKEKTLKSY